MLLSLVLFFSADMLDLEDRARVEDTQLAFVLLLQKYIAIRYSNVYSRTVLFNYSTCNCTRINRA